MVVEMTRKINRAAKTSPKKKMRKFWPTKIVALIVSAIQDLRETKGSTPSKIIGYISYGSNVDDGKVKRQVKSVLKRGLKYGILRRYRGHYFLPTCDELDRANRIALRFAKLPLPSAYSTKSNVLFPGKIAPMASQRKTGKSTAKLRRTKRLGKPRPILISPTTSLTNAVCNADEL
ncbi:uncharacterized protein LOC117235443 [Bombus vosnesenskii]|uniref:Uncharacterized protein LOC117235443 n=1 Tax=Bombus vosnesenskii TaxID=207650 RepID=A0A6J3KMB5_9HYME|nr:uncharacterized protein LOC117235443 [Bombus vosnesenskii]